MNIRQAVVFSILMQNNEGIVGKSSGYILEKLSSCKQLLVPEVILDNFNLAIFQEYAKKWDYKWNKEEDLMKPLSKFYKVNKITGEFEKNEN